jgi:hypothetical protein
MKIDKAIDKTRKQRHCTCQNSGKLKAANLSQKRKYTITCPKKDKISIQPETVPKCRILEPQPGI